jgi:hypothetical protein
MSPRKTHRNQGIEKKKDESTIHEIFVHNLRGTGMGIARALAWRCLSVWNQPELLSPLVDVPHGGNRPDERLPFDHRRWSLGESGSAKTPNRRSVTTL